MRRGKKKVQLIDEEASLPRQHLLFLQEWNKTYVTSSSAFRYSTTITGTIGMVVCPLIKATCRSRAFLIRFRGVVVLFRVGSFCAASHAPGDRRANKNVAYHTLPLLVPNFRTNKPLEHVLRPHHSGIILVPVLLFPPLRPAPPHGLISVPLFFFYDRKRGPLARLPTSTCSHRQVS